MKKTILILLTTALFSSCGSYTRIGTLSMVSTRSIDSKMEYVELARYVTSTSKRNKHSPVKVKTEQGRLDVALDNAVSSIPGGEYLKNIQVYIKGNNIKIVADVWGVPNAAPTQKELLKKKKN